MALDQYVLLMLLALKLVPPAVAAAHCLNRLPLTLLHRCKFLPISPPHATSSLSVTHQSLQAHFLHTYNERASALTAEVEALKGRVREAHRHAKGAEAKIRSLQAGLQEAQAAKEVGRGGHWGDAAAVRCCCAVLLLCPAGVLPTSVAASLRTLRYSPNTLCQFLLAPTKAPPTQAPPYLTPHNVQTLEAAVKEVEGDVVQATQTVVAQYQQQLEEAQAADGACQQEASGNRACAWQAAACIRGVGGHACSAAFCDCN